MGPEILHQERQTGKGAIEIGAVKGRIGDRILEHFDDARQRRIHPGDAGRCLRRQFRGRHSPLLTRAASATPSWSAHSSQFIGKFIQSILSA